MITKFKKQDLLLKNQSGFSIVEFIVVAVTISVLASIAVPNFKVFKSKTYNQIAHSDYKNILRAMDIEQSDPDTSISYSILNRRGQSMLPQALDTVGLSDGVHLRYATRTQLRRNTITKSLEVTHTKGDLIYRMRQVNNVRREQVINK